MQTVGRARRDNNSTMLKIKSDEEQVLETYSVWDGESQVGQIMHLYYLSQGVEDIWEASLFINGVRSDYSRDYIKFDTKGQAITYLNQKWKKR